ncbi:hypothetical protein BHE97_02290 [Aeromicrobium sp. PE09-221]|uniref:DUF721 domain-containing protein n=1 Tax=Aeromicrobium sp. PE09-221 TaxID=1898043 RepID=UPI000B3EBA56|nr:DciA family protein [Aeromicrobium sp. PE09-221]OUZ12547.1 hypothetical protein BHE97_02290 [Aeromicrobium sp. PE09-221]
MSETKPGDEEWPEETQPEDEVPWHSADDVVKMAREIADSYRASGAPAAPQRRRGRVRRRATRPQREDATPLGDFVGELVHQQGWADQLAATRVFTDWASVVGPEVAQHSEVVGFEDGIVRIQATSTAWARELTLLAPRLVAKLNELLGDGSVIRLDIRGPQAPSWTRGRRSVRGGRGPRDTYG